ncbi:hypothetical protein [Vibrio atlanticus]|nr:hypothetical protein [Vibrio atlanticus]
MTKAERQGTGMILRKKKEVVGNWKNKREAEASLFLCSSSNEECAKI